MKFPFNRLVLGLLAVAVMASCKKNENKVFYEGGTAPVLTSSAFTSPLVLSIANKNDHAVTLYWTNPAYRFTTGVSSQDVNYTIQVDTTGQHFANGGIDGTAVAKDLLKKFTVSDLNTMLLGIGLIENRAYDLEIRVKSTLRNSSAPLYSNIITMNVTPYLDVVYPVPANLYITGSATPLNWQCACANDGTGDTQKFTKVSSSRFEITLQLSGGNSYLLIPVWSSWGAKYGGVGANNTNNPLGDSFKPDGGDLKSPATGGLYKIVVDFKTGKFTVTPQ